MKKIAFAGPWITDAEVNFVAEAAREGHYETYDKYIKIFEEEAKAYFGVKYAIGVHTCTHALHLACASIGLHEGDEVIVTDHSWVATAYAISYTGATCVFVDIDPHTLCISPEAIRKAITPKTKAIMLVHNFGVPADMDEIMDIAKKYNLRVIEDAAPAMGSIYKGKKCGTIGDVGCISFQGAKIGISSEGGLYLTNNEEFYKKAYALATMGRDDSVTPFWSNEVGFQYTIGSLPAAMATIQMRRIDELVANKRKIHGWYTKRFENSGMNFSMVKEKEGSFANYTYPAVWVGDISDTSIIYTELKKENIYCRTGFPPMSFFPHYFNFQKTPNYYAQLFWKSGLVVPAAHNLVEEDIDRVCDSIFKIIKEKGYA